MKVKFLYAKSNCYNQLQASGGLTVDMPENYTGDSTTEMPVIDLEQKVPTSEVVEPLDALEYDYGMKIYSIKCL